MPNFGRPPRETFGGITRLANAQSKSYNAYFGLAAVSSVRGGFSVVISTAVVKSGAIFETTLYPLTGAWSGQTPFNFGVRTLSPGGFFELGSVGSVALVGSFALSWELQIPA
jgi:hypothetical protein